MNEMSCGVIRDLLPLYVDGALSDESRALVERHLVECEDCRKALSQMREEIPAPRAEEPGVADALKGLNRALKRTKFKAIAIAVVAAVLVGWFTIANYQYLAMAWTKNCVPEKVEVSNLCQTADGVIRFYADLTSGYRYEGVLMKYDDGVAYVNFQRQVLPSADRSEGFDEWWVDLHTILRDGVYGYQYYSATTGEPDEFVELTTIRIGTPDDYVTVWEKGTEIPLIDEKTARQYDDWEYKIAN